MLSMWAAAGGSGGAPPLLSRSPAAVIATEVAPTCEPAGG